mmetsp:Transcript_282/g.893  ORF Transcript_282/g.893 Transcript_282/m.893 type:complete len:218 (-) Transcript_282:896-1549(-)
MDALSAMAESQSTSSAGSMPLGASVASTTAMTSLAKPSAESAADRAAERMMEGRRCDAAARNGRIRRGAEWRGSLCLVATRTSAGGRTGGRAGGASRADPAPVTSAAASCASARLAQPAATASADRLAICAMPGAEGVCASTSGRDHHRRRKQRGTCAGSPVSSRTTGRRTLKNAPRTGWTPMTARLQQGRSASAERAPCWGEGPCVLNPAGLMDTP